MTESFKSLPSPRVVGIPTRRRKKGCERKLYTCEAKSKLFFPVLHVKAAAAEQSTHPHRCRESPSHSSQGLINQVVGHSQSHRLHTWWSLTKSADWLNEHVWVREIQQSTDAHLKQLQYEQQSPRHCRAVTRNLISDGEAGAALQCKYATAYQ